MNAVRQAIRHIADTLPRAVVRGIQDRFVYQPVIRQKRLSVDAPPMFDTVFFEARTRCNAHCSFCSASIENDTRADVSMTAELHEKVLQELVAAGFKGRIAYHNNSEPLIFRELPQFVARARALLPESHIQILSNGRSLTPEKADVLIQAGIDELSINYYNDDFTVELPGVLRTVATDVLPKHFTADEVDVTGVGADNHAPVAKFKYQVIRRRESDVLDSRAGTSPNKRLPNGGPRGFCQYPWTQLIVSADGRVPMCCADLNISESVGNAASQTVMEIWHGDRLRRMREALWRGDRQAISTCSQCDFYGVKRTPKTMIGKLVDAMTR